MGDLPGDISRRDAAEASPLRVTDTGTYTLVAESIAPKHSWHKSTNFLFFIGFCAILSAAVGLLAGLVPGWILGPTLGASLVGLGLVWRWRVRVQSRTYPRWRDVMPCYLSIQDKNLRIVETNPQFEADFGPSIGQQCYAAYKKRDSPCPGCPVLRTFEDGRDHYSEETVVTRDGTVSQVVVTSTPVYDNGGEMVGCMEMSTNITEILSLRRQLDRSKQDYERLFDLVPCYVTVHDKDYTIVESNALFRRDFGEAKGCACYSAYKGRDALCPDCPVEKTFADGEIHSGEETVTTRDGQQANVIVYSMPVHDEKGNISAVMEVSTNITEVKRLQRQLALMGMAVAGMAHRIKNILMGLEGGIFVVNAGFEDDDQATISQGWEMVERNVGKISRLVKDLLYCSKERAPKFERDVEPLAVAEEVFALFEPRTAKEKITLLLERGEGIGRGCYDPAGLQTLLTNLVSNAVDACRFDMTEGKTEHTITIRCTAADPKGVVFTVSDDGPGIPDDVSHKVFENFFSTKGTEGTGLGLLVVQKVTEEHGGHVTFTTGAGEGTTFTVTLPGTVPCAEEKAS